jgi:hypothetical protein
MKKETVIEGYKGFNKDLTCIDFQYKEGETFTTEKKPIRCTANGFHFCTEPLDVFQYYDPANSVFHKVEGFGESDTSSEDSKIAVSKIKIGAEIKLFDFCKLAIDVILKKTKDIEKNSGNRSAAVNSGYRSAAVNSGYSSAAVNSGDRSAAVNSGYSSAAVNSGNRSAAEVTGNDSIACGFGYMNKAKASLNSWIVLIEWDDNYKIINVKSAKIDGRRLKANTFYKLENNKFVIAE